MTTPMAAIRLITLTVLVSALLAACGGAPAAVEPTSAPAAAPAPTAARAAPTDAPAPTAAEVAAACAAGQRLFAHELLATEPVCVPEQPERIATLEPAAHDLLMALDRPPVAAVGYLDSVLAETYPELSFAANNIADLGFPPNLEVLVAAQPDLIITSDSSAEVASYEQLSAIAPTVMLRGGPSGAWKRWLDAAAAALGLEAEQARLFDEYEARLEAFRATVGDPAELAVSIVRVQPDDQVMLNLVNSFPSVVVADAGLGRPESQALDAATAQERYGSEIGAMISLEQAQLADADVIIVWGAQASADQQAAAEERWQALNANPVWASLSAVRAGDVHRVGSHWVGWGLHAAHAVIDDLFTIVAEVDPATVAPNPFRTEQASAAEPPAVQIVAETAEGRLIRHPLGETLAPLEPQRVVTLIPGGGVDYLLTYGIVPVAAADYRDFGFAATARPFYYDLVTFPTAVSPEAIVGLGCCAGNYSIERIVAADPDLIIGWTYQMEDIYDQLSAIAPTVAIEPYNGPEWIEAGRVMAAVLGREAQHAAWVAEWEAAITALRAEYGDPSDIRITILNAFDPAKLRVNGSATQQGQIARAAGFQVTEPPANYDPAAGISVELLPSIDADVIFVTTNFFKPEDWERFQGETYGNSALWQQLAAVQAGRVYAVDTFFWTNGGPAANTQLVLPDLFRAVFEGEAPRVFVSGE